MAKLLLLVDGDALLYRAANAIPSFTNDRGLPINGLYGFAGMIWTLRETFVPSHMAVAFTADPPLVKHSWDPRYKINHYEHPPEIKRQMPYAIRFVQALGVQAFLETGYEADDVLATLARGAPRMPVRIVTSDRDFYQLVSEQIWVLRPIRYFSLLRNEINTRQSHRTAQEWERTGGGYVAAEDRAQRHTLALRDVAYVIRALPVPKPGDVDAAKYRDQFRRRVARGQCHARPYLGCREFAAWFAPVEGNEQPVALTADLGRMLYDLDYPQGNAGAARPRFFQARLEGGILRVPPRPNAEE